MLDTTTKRRIDTARDILVGKVPDPKSQVEQITIALIYKFMDDMDRESEDLGGQRQFFAGEWQKYGWAQLMQGGLGGKDMLERYSEAITTMPQNPGIPALFRDIFKNAYLPYRDPETLRAFLRIIDEFQYDHSEKLGDAFEYLLSVLGSQGDAGQFRTPRHIIDFMVAVLDPKKGETILDPACGTAGFLISSYKHILNANRNEQGESTLTPDDRDRMAQQLHGYDISPDMVRLSLVNLYLHGFTAPRIEEYDTLTSEEKWNEYADVILANPPFMSPKGGIKPHRRFSVQSKRSEVLFVDYIAEHLGASGRAGIIVPEGIIFQSQSAYKELRRMLVDESLVAVVSLPAGVFNPYSGVKTSILILDKGLAKRIDSVAFFKIEADGFGLGAQRRPIEQNDLPKAAEELGEYLRRLREGESLEDFAPTLGHIVAKEKIAANGNYNLSGERYREGTARDSIFELVPLGEVCDLIGGGTPSKQEASYWENGTVKWISSKYINDEAKITGYDLISAKAVEESSTRIAPKGSTIIITRVSVGKFAIADDDYAINQDLTALVSKDPQRLAPEFIKVVASHISSIVDSKAEGIGVRGVTRAFLSELQIPLPPLDVQQEIVAEIEGYQKVIDGARAVVAHYRPHIPIHPDWPMVELNKFARLINGRAYKQEELLKEGPTPVLRVGNFFSNRSWYYSDLQLDEDKYCNEGDLLYAWSASFGPRIWEGPRAIYHYHIWKVELTSSQVEKKFLYYLLEADSEKIKSEGSGIAMIHATKGGMEQRKFPLPPLSTQQAIVAEIEAEQELVAANRELITRFEQKIAATLACIWGEEEKVAAPKEYAIGNEMLSMAAEP